MPRKRPAPEKAGGLDSRGKIGGSDSRRKIGGLDSRRKVGGSDSRARAADRPAGAERQARPRHSGMLLAGIQPHGNPVVARVWIPARSMPE
jgi:hypothetical protein